ncbi:MAG: class I SAM-dependent methyltransferase [Methanothrix sp.]|nr:class I SAM-dependent methyltransferase [Methanothrix sp.]
MDDNFYLAFEDRFRGSRDLIKSRLRAYMLFVKPLKAIYEDRKVVDLGCGRGEWLELMEEEGFEAHGVDLDEEMLTACQSAGLSATKEDAVEHLKKLPDESAVVVSGFHIIEHIPFDSLQILVHEAFRVLKPGGLLILETPNPENMIVSMTEFYLDPTHQNPIPPALLYFLVEYYGFARIKIVRLNESIPISDSKEPRLMDVFMGVSPDYSVVAQKSGKNEHLILFDSAFDKDYGVNISDLTMRYDRLLHSGELERFNALSSRLNELDTHFHEQLTAEREKSERLENEIATVYSTLSWRITHPLRVAFCAISRVKARFLRILRSIRRKIAYMLSKPLVFMIHFAIAHPSLKNKSAYFVKKSRRLDIWIHRFVISYVLDGSSTAAQRNTPAQIISSMPLSPGLSDLSPYARQIYIDLKTAIERNRRLN